MSRSQIRLLLFLVAGAVLLGELAISARSRNRPSLLQPRTVDNSGRSTPSNQSPQSNLNRGLPPSVPLQRDHETTIRSPQTSSGAAPMPRAVDAVPEDRLLALVEEATVKTERRYLDVAEYTPWQIMHGVLALRGEYQLKQGDKLVNGIDFISSGPTFRGETWWVKTPFGGRGHPFTVPYAFEGHINQFPALLAMSALPATHVLKTSGGPITIQDMVRNAQMTVNTQEEISWTLWFLTQYVDQDARWTNQHNQSWSMAELVRAQVAASVDDAPCGGTHGLFAIAFARNAYLQKHGKLQGVWMNAEYKLRQHIELARQLQNPDGSFSSNWFRGRGYTADFKERIKTSGHMLEWLMMALPNSRLNEPWVRRGVQAVANDLIRNATAPAECGPMYHALHALVLYRERVAPPTATPPQQELASSEPRRLQEPAEARSTLPTTPTIASQPNTARSAPVAPTNEPPANEVPAEPAPALAGNRTSPTTAGPGSKSNENSASALTSPSMVAPGLGYLSPAGPTTLPGAISPRTAEAIPGKLESPPSARVAEANPMETRTDAAGTPSSATPEPAGADLPGPGKRPLLVLKKPVPEATPSPAVTAAPPAPQLDRMTVGSSSDNPVDETAGPATTPEPAGESPLNAILTVHPRDLPIDVTGATPPVETMPNAQPILPALAADEPMTTPRSQPSVPKFGDNLVETISEGSTAGKPTIGTPPPAPVRVATGDESAETAR